MARNLIARQPGVIQVQTYGEALHVVVDSSDERLGQLQQLLEQEGIGYWSLRTAQPRMEEAFISLINQLDAEARA
jgi:hypothetical protein